MFTQGLATFPDLIKPGFRSGTYRLQLRLNHSTGTDQFGEEVRKSNAKSKTDSQRI